MSKVRIDDLVELFGEMIDLSGIKIDEDSLLGEDIPADSKQMLSILSRIESRYRFRFEPKEILDLKTLGDIFEVVRRRVNTVY